MVVVIFCFFRPLLTVAVTLHVPDARVTTNSRTTTHTRRDAAATFADLTRIPVGTATTVRNE